MPVPAYARIQGRGRLPRVIALGEYQQPPGSCSPSVCAASASVAVSLVSTVEVVAGSPASPSGSCMIVSFRSSWVPREPSRCQAGRQGVSFRQDTYPPLCMIARVSGPSRSTHNPTPPPTGGGVCDGMSHHESSVSQLAFAQVRELLHDLIHCDSSKLRCVS